MDKLEYNLYSVKDEINRMIQTESDGLSKNLKLCQETIDKVIVDVEYLSNQMVSKNSEMEIQKESLTKRIQDHIMELRANFDKDLNTKVETLQHNIEEHKQILTQKIADTLETLTGSPVSLTLEPSKSVSKDLTLKVQQTFRANS